MTVAPCRTSSRNPLAHLVRSVHDATRPAGIPSAHVGATEHVAITVTSGLGEHGNGDLHSWPGYQTVVHRLFHAEVGTSCISYAGYSRVEGDLHVVDGLVETIRQGSVESLERVDVAHREMHVAVEEAGEHRLARNVDLLITAEPDTDIGDAPFLDANIGRCWRCPRPVEDISTCEHSRSHESRLAAKLRRSRQSGEA